LDYLGGAYPYEVVGVTRDALYEGLRSEPRPEIFIPHAQNPYLLMNVIARTAVPAEDMLQAARAQVLSVDREQSVHSVTTLERLLDEISFEGPDLQPKDQMIDAAYVQKMLADTVKDQDLSRYIL